VEGLLVAAKLPKQLSYRPSIAIDVVTLRQEQERLRREIVDVEERLRG
jgi:hypothetical protein